MRWTRRSAIAITTAALLVGGGFAVAQTVSAPIPASAPTAGRPSDDPATHDQVDDSRLRAAGLIDPSVDDSDGRVDDSGDTWDDSDGRVDDSADGRSGDADHGDAGHGDDDHGDDD